MSKLIVDEILSYTFKPHAWPLDLSHELEEESYMTLSNGESLSSIVLKHIYPELAYWRPQQIVAALKQYFQEVYYVDSIPVEKMEHLRECEFLAWLYDWQEKVVQGQTGHLNHDDLVSGELDRIAETLWTLYSTGQMIQYVAAMQVQQAV